MEVQTAAVIVQTRSIRGAHSKRVTGAVPVAAAWALVEREVEYRIIEQQPDRVKDPENCIVGNAADLEVLKRADIVMSYTSIGADAMLNVLKRSKVLMLAEGLDIFRLKVPIVLAGKAIAEAV